MLLRNGRAVVEQSPYSHRGASTAQAALLGQVESFAVLSSELTELTELDEQKFVTAPPSLLRPVMSMGKLIVANPRQRNV